jgi:adenylate cyclase
VTALTISTTINNTPILALPRSLTDDRPSIAVLPFRVQSANSDDTRFADGIIESIIHILLGIENLFVIGRDTALAYADLDIDLRDVGRDLGVRYVLTGSVRRTDKRLRIAAELVDALGGSLIRSDRHTGALTDLFDMQASIARDVVSVIAPAVREHELARALRMHPDNMTGYDLLLQALCVDAPSKQERFSMCAAGNKC